MKRRSYAILEIWKNYGQPSQELLGRSEDFGRANHIMTDAFKSRTSHHDKFYIIEAQVLVKVEADEDEPERVGPPTVRPQDT